MKALEALRRKGSDVPSELEERKERLLLERTTDSIPQHIMILNLKPFFLLQKSL
jgi:hypothetical protein